MKISLEKITDGIPEKKYLEFIVYGTISGIPFSILASAISALMTDLKFELAIITLLVSARVPYALKFLWAPLIDGINIPILSRLGKRKSWMMVTASAMCFILVILGSYELKNNFSFIYYSCLLFCFMSASFDIAFDAFRIDTVEPEMQGYAASSTVLGYRIGMIIPSSGMLAIAHLYGWSIAFYAMATILFISIFYMPFLKEKKAVKKIDRSYIRSIEETVINPFKDFLLSRSTTKYESIKLALIILLMITLYKLCDVLLLAVSTPFYMYLGYDKLEIASVAKTYGLFPTLIGSFLGAEAVRRYKGLNALLICGIFQALVNFSFIWLHHSDKTIYSLMIAISLENLAGGAGITALVAYMSNLCNKNYSATQYALFTSFTAFMNSTIPMKSGSWVEYYGWDLYFLFTVVSAIPGLTLILYLKRIYKNQASGTKIAW